MCRQLSLMSFTAGGVCFAPDTKRRAPRRTAAEVRDARARKARPAMNNLTHHQPERLLPVEVAATILSFVDTPEKRYKQIAESGLKQLREKQEGEISELLRFQFPVQRVVELICMGERRGRSKIREALVKEWWKANQSAVSESDLRRYLFRRSHTCFKLSAFAKKFGAVLSDSLMPASDTWETLKRSAPDDWDLEAELVECRKQNPAWFRDSTHLYYDDP